MGPKMYAKQAGMTNIDKANQTQTPDANKSHRSNGKGETKSSDLSYAGCEERES